MSHTQIPNNLLPNLCASQNYMEAKLPSENYFYWWLPTASCDFLSPAEVFRLLSSGLLLVNTGCMALETKPFSPTLNMLLLCCPWEDTHYLLFLKSLGIHSQNPQNWKPTPLPCMNFFYLVSFSGQHLRDLVLCTVKGILLVNSLRNKMCLVTILLKPSIQETHLNHE